MYLLNCILISVYKKINMKKTLLVGELLFYGKPVGVVANNLFNYAIGTILATSPRSILFAEFYGNTSAVGGGETPEGDISTNPNLNTEELSGGGNVGAIGYGYYFKKKLLLSFGVSYDNNKATLSRPGIDWKFVGK
jgi:hypothetical protein